MRTRPIIIGHRGNAGKAPANTIAGFQEAVELGVDFIEMDMQVTRDGEIVLVHDSIVDHTTNGTGRVDSMTLHELRQLDAGSWKSSKYRDEKIPTMEETLKLMIGKCCFALDLKDSRAIPRMVQLINDYDIRDQVVVVGCDLPLALMVRKTDPRLTITLNMDTHLCTLAETNPAQFISSYTTQAAENQMAALCVHQAYITYDLLLTAHLRGLPVWAWTIDQPEDIHRMLTLRVDAIISNQPERVLKIIADKFSGKTIRSQYDK